VQVVVVALGGHLAFGRAGAFPTLMLASAGIGTAVPLLLFAAAAKRLPLSVAGFLQYLTPILQLLVGVLALHEAMPAARLAGFALVWIALVVLVVEGLVIGGRARRRVLLAAPRVTDA
jgi:chloramphenicol-sensitive protein RarD